MAVNYEKSGIVFLMAFGVLCFLFGAFKVACAIALGNPGEFITAIGALLLAAAALCGPISEYAGWRAGRLFYPLAWLKNPEMRLAAAEALCARKDFFAAKEALLEILGEEPGNLAAALALAKALLAWKGAEGRAEACAVLSRTLAGSAQVVSGGSGAVLLLADLLEEEGLKARAMEVLEQELGKGCCGAEAALLRRRLDALSAASAS